jgi:hypothetical protein
MDSVYQYFHGEFQIEVKWIKPVSTLLKGKYNMLTENTELSTIVRRTWVIFISCIAVTVFTSVNAFAQHYLSNGVRDSLTHKERIALMHEEYPHCSWSEVENRVKSREQVFHYRNPKMTGRGNFRAHLSPSERVRLIMEEHKYLMPHEIPIIHKAANTQQAFFHPGNKYVYGVFRENLSDAEKRQLINEE